MRRPFPTAPMASCFALTGFAVAVVSGLVSGSQALTVIEGGLFALVACYLVGLFAGRACVAITREHMKRTTNERPVEAASPEPGGFAPSINVDVLPAQEAEAA